MGKFRAILKGLGAGNLSRRAANLKAIRMRNTRGIDLSGYVAPKKISPMSKEERLAARKEWHKDADPMLKDEEGNPTRFFIGTTHNNKTEFGIRSNRVSGKRSDGSRSSPYQRRGHVFASDDPKFSEDFASKGWSIEEIVANPNRPAFRTGEGNMYPVNINTQKMFNPNNEDHLNELTRHVIAKEKSGISTAMDPNYKGNAVVYKSPLSHSLHKMKDSADGWRISEREATLQSLDELGYGGQFVNEGGHLSPSIFNPADIKSIHNTGKYNSASRDMLNSGAGLGAALLLEDSMKKEQ